MNTPVHITPRGTESGQAALSPGGPNAAAPATLGAPVGWGERGRRSLTDLTVLLLADWAAAMESPAFDCALHREHPQVGEILPSPPAQP